jgi:hypothetical protein
MIWQYLIVGLIILTAAVITARKLYRFLTNPLRKCEGCAMGCGGCPVEEFKTQNLKLKIKKSTK